VEIIEKIPFDVYQDQKYAHDNFDVESDRIRLLDFDLERLFRRVIQVWIELVGELNNERQQCRIQCEKNEIVRYESEEAKLREFSNLVDF
jgi:hypothetical protein